MSCNCARTNNREIKRKKELVVGCLRFVSFDLIKKIENRFALCKKKVCLFFSRKWLNAKVIITEFCLSGEENQTVSASVENTQREKYFVFAVIKYIYDVFF